MDIPFCLLDFQILQSNALISSMLSMLNLWSLWLGFVAIIPLHSSISLFLCGIVIILENILQWPSWLMDFGREWSFGLKMEWNGQKWLRKRLYELSYFQNFPKPLFEAWFRNVMIQKNILKNAFWTRKQKKFLSLWIYNNFLQKLEN